MYWSSTKRALSFLIEMQRNLFLIQLKMAHFDRTICQEITALENFEYALYKRKVKKNIYI